MNRLIWVQRLKTSIMCSYETPVIPAGNNSTGLEIIAFNFIIIRMFTLFFGKLGFVMFCLCIN